MPLWAVVPVGEIRTKERKDPILNRPTTDVRFVRKHLCAAEFKLRAISRGISCGNFGKLLDISVAGGQ
jgi:hypothetical protein